MPCMVETGFGRHREKCNWLRDKIETPAQTEYNCERHEVILDRLIWSSRIENSLATKGTAAKRFGLEGSETLIPGMKEMFDRASDLGVENIVIAIRLFAIYQMMEQEIKQNLADLQASYTKAQERRRDGRKREQEIKQNVTELKDAYMKAQEITKARRKGVKTSVQRIHKLDQLVAHNHEDKKMIAYMRNQGWKGSSSNHMEFDSQDEEGACEPNKQISAKSNYNLENQPSGDPNMHFVESPAALAPPEVHMDMVAQKQHKAKRVAAASQPVPDDDDDSSE